MTGVFADGIINRNQTEKSFKSTLVSEGVKGNPVRIRNNTRCCIRGAFLKWATVQMHGKGEESTDP